MKTRTRIALGSLAGAAAIHLAFIACSATQSTPDATGLDAVASEVATMADSVTSAEMGTAEAQTPPPDAGGPMEAPCVAVPPDSGLGDSYFATFNIPGFDPSTGTARVHVCDYVCTAGACVTPFNGQPYSCLTNATLWMAPGRIQVTCGAGAAHGQRALLWR